MARPTGTLEWKLSSLAHSMHVTEEDVQLYFTDGRRISFLLERRIAYELLNGTLAPSEGAGWDVRDAQGEKWEVRSISQGGVYFCPSYMVGSGRSFEEAGFLRKLDEVSGYVVSYITAFPSIPVWTVPTATVRSWWLSGLLGTSTKASRENALRLVETAH